MSRVRISSSAPNRTPYLEVSGGFYFRMIDMKIETYTFEVTEFQPQSRRYEAGEQDQGVGELHAENL